MKPSRISPSLLAKSFNQDVAAVDTSLQEFLKSGSPTSTHALRTAVRRLRVCYSVFPKKPRRVGQVKRYVDMSKKLAKATGKLRDYDTMTAWASQIAAGKDSRTIASDLEKLRASSLRAALQVARELSKTERPSVEPKSFGESKVERRVEKVEKRLVKRVNREFEEFLSTQEVKVMHALRKDAKRLRYLLEIPGAGAATSLHARLRSIQDNLGAIRDHDLVITYLRSKSRLMSDRSLVREEMAKRHARLEEFITKNRGRGHLVPVPVEEKVPG